MITYFEKATSIVTIAIECAPSKTLFKHLLSPYHLDSKRTTYAQTASRCYAYTKRVVFITLSC